MSSKRLARSRRRHAEETRVWTDADLAEAGYPKLHVRMMAAIYSRYQIAWIGQPERPSQMSKYSLSDPEPLAGLAMTPARREAIMAAIQCSCDSSGHQMCVAFSPRDVVYFSPEQPPFVGGSEPWMRHGQGSGKV